MRSSDFHHLSVVISSFWGPILYAHCNFDGCVFCPNDFCYFCVFQQNFQILGFSALFLKLGQHCSGLSDLFDGGRAKTFKWIGQYRTIMVRHLLMGV